MKKTLLIGLMCLVMVTSAFAGSISIESDDFEDGSHDYTGEAEIDADTLDGHTYKQINKKIVKNKKVNNNQQDELDDLNSQRSAFLKDEVGGGISSRGVWKVFSPLTRLYDSYDYIVDYLTANFVTKEKYDDLQHRVDKLEATVELLKNGEYLNSKNEQFTYGDITCETAKVKANREGVSVTFLDVTSDGVTCE